MTRIDEKDWKTFRKMKDELLRAACERIFVKVEKLIEKREDKEHDTYIELYKLIHKEDKGIARMFDDPRRNNAIQKIVELRRNGLITDFHFGQFSPRLRQTVETFLR